MSQFLTWSKVLRAWGHGPYAQYKLSRSDLEWALSVDHKRSTNFPRMIGPINCVRSAYRWLHLHRPWQNRLDPKEKKKNRSDNSDEIEGWRVATIESRNLWKPSFLCHHSRQEQDAVAAAAVATGSCVGCGIILPATVAVSFFSSSSSGTTATASPKTRFTKSPSSSIQLYRYSGACDDDNCEDVCFQLYKSSIV